MPPTKKRKFGNDEPRNLEHPSNQLWRKMLDHGRIGFPKHQPFMTDDCLAELITDYFVRQALPQQTSRDLARYASDNKKLLAIVLRIFKDNIDRAGAAMDSFMCAGLRDSHLPVENFQEDGVPCTSHNDAMICEHLEEYNAFHYEPWDDAHYAEFCDIQWQFLLPKFNGMERLYDFHPNLILPFKIDDMSKKRTGYFGDVFRVRMLRSQCCASSEQQIDQSTLNVALKEFRGAVLKDVRREWEREAAALRAFNELNNAHIIRGISAFSHNHNHYLLMEWANGGNLGEFWGSPENRKPDLTAGRVLEILHQFKGLITALMSIHEYKLPGDGSVEEISVMPAPGVPAIVEPEGGQGKTNWRHGDLKPANILRCAPDSPHDWLGTLKIGDLGRARPHNAGTRVRKEQYTRELFSSVQYEPPEVQKALKAAWSRLFDVWSMGCIFFECLVWMLYGYDVLHEVLKPTEIKDGSPYWVITDYSTFTAAVSDMVRRWMREMLRRDPECKSSKAGIGRGDSTAIGDLLTMVQTKMLVVPILDATVYTKNYRAPTSNLLEDLEEMISRASSPSGNGYLYSGAKRVEIKPPGGNSQSPTTLGAEDAQLNPGNIPARRAKSPPRSNLVPNDHKHLEDSYRHEYEDRYDSVDDNRFVRFALQRPAFDADSRLPNQASELCNRCQGLDLLSPDVSTTDRMEDLQSRAKKGCDLCALLLEVAGNKRPDEIVRFDRVASGLRMDRTGLPQISISTSSRNATYDAPVHSKPFIQMGQTHFPEAGSVAHFDLLREWLNDCDCHEECEPQMEPRYPTRLLDIGSLASPRSQLVLTTSLLKHAIRPIEYVALSHPWGNKVQDHYCTTLENYKEHQQGIPEDRLPQTFKDAYMTTRSLGKQYLWIDSLCIIQGPGGDYTEEAERMESVFSSAYCAIAATDASGTASGFLKRTVREDRLVSLRNPLSEPNSDDWLWLRKSRDDFDKDVLHGPLNKRGWVLQERALARRTIHFTNNQTYWECGRCIRCETFTRLQNSHVAILGDANFPRHGIKPRESTKGGRIYLYESLYEQFSGLALTKSEDRPLAIAGLEQRLLHAFKAAGGSRAGGFGLFGDHWGRGLLWRRYESVDRMERLTLGPSGRRPPPTWSWMGHMGRISYLRPPQGEVKWQDNDMKLPWNNSPRSGWLSSHRGDQQSLSGTPRRFRIPRGTKEDVALLVYDDRANEGKELLEDCDFRCITIGTTMILHPEPNERHYVLLVKAKQGLLPGMDVCERVGVGFMPASFISRSTSMLAPETRVVVE